MRPLAIRTHLLLLVTAASVPLVAAAVYDGLQDREQADEWSRATLRTLASAMVSNTSARLTTAERALTLLTRAHFAEALDFPGCEERLHSSMLSCAHCVEVFITGPDGRVRCASAPPRKDTSVADAPWFQRLARERRFDASAPWDDPVAGRRVSVVSLPLFDDQRALRGAAHVTFELDGLDPRIPTEMLPPDVRFDFFSNEGEVIWRNHDPEHVTGATAGAISTPALSVRDGEFVAPGFDGIERLYAVVPMPLTGWVATAGVPVTWIHERPRLHALRTVQSAAVAIVLLGVLAMLVARRISRPIAELERVARAVDGGDHEVRATPMGPRELRAVAEALNKMLVSHRQGEEQLRAFLESSAVIAWMKDAEGRYVFVTDNLLRRFALTRERVLGHTEEELWPAPFSDNFRRRDQEALEGEGPLEYVQAVPNPDGTTSSWMTHKFRFMAPDGVRVGGLAVDLTELQRAEEARRVSEALLSQAFTNSPIGMGLISLEGRPLRVNPATVRMLGASADELLAQPYLELLAPADREKESAALTALRDGDEDSGQAERRFLRKNGLELWVQRTLTVVRDGAGKPLHFVVQLQDINEQKSAEASARLATVGTLAAGAAHEINNPLTFVMSNLRFVRDELERVRPALPVELAAQLQEPLDALDEAHGGAERIAAIIAGLKAFSRQQEETPLEPTDVQQVLESALRLTLAQRRNQAVTETRFEFVPPVRANPHQLEQVFVNLLVNAAQAIPSGNADAHRITVTVRRALEGEVVVEVSDTGVGITDDVRPHLFEPFFTTKPVGVGTGLGLPTAHGIVTSLGGRIEVESTPGRGSTFRVVLPALGSPVPALPPPAPRPRPEVPLPPGRVLIIDDDAAVGRSIARNLRGGPQIVTLEDPREALRRLEQGEPCDLVICDLMMPTLSGEELQRQLRATRPELAESMVFLTGGAFTPAAEAFLEATTSRWLTKPVEPSALRRLVAERLSAAPKAGGA